jgi:D-alanyl-lipoteichoic acid acyltransferase DltB (MBOAT superfamily)
MVIADNLAIYVNAVFERVKTGEPTRGFYLFLGAVAFAFQLYADFSGYMDMVVGAGASLGIKMAENFNAPFFSRSISEFWRRWHITLGAWLRDYVLYPLQRAFIKKGKTKTQKALINFSCMFATWFLIGYWHGASWNFIIGSGLLHWFYMVMETLRPPRQFFAPLEILRTFLLVCVGFIFFRSENVLLAFRFIKEMFTGTGGALRIYETPRLVMLACAVLVLLLAESSGFKIERQKTAVRWAVYVLLALSVVVFGAYGIGYEESGFIYSNF